MSVHLHAVQDAVSAVEPAATVDAVFFVLQKRGGPWSPDARIMSVFDNERDAEEVAQKMGVTLPHQTFAVAVLRSEARHTAKPIELVRVTD